MHISKIPKMEGIEHKTVSANGLNLHIAQKGDHAPWLPSRGTKPTWLR